MFGNGVKIFRYCFYYIFTTENQCIEASHVHVALLKRRKFRQIAQSKQHVLPGLAVAVAVGLGQAVVLLCEDLTADMLFSSDVLEIHAAKVVKYFESCKTGGSTQALPQPGSLRIFNKMAKTAQKRALFMCRMPEFKKIYT